MTTIIIFLPFCSTSKSTSTCRKSKQFERKIPRHFITLKRKSNHPPQESALRIQTITATGRANANVWVREIKAKMPPRIFRQLATFSHSLTESELQKLKFQSSDDMNDCVKYISAINDKLTQVELLNEHQHTYAEYLLIVKSSSNQFSFYSILVTV